MLAPGERFDRYTIDALLGSGGMGEVYSARDSRLERRVALKILKGGGGETGTHDSAGHAARLLREARAAAALDHPNVVAIFDVGEVDGTTFLAMELIEGRSLRSFIGKDVPVATRIAWLADIARALGLAHRRGLVHRDIKPENVMVRDDGVIKVLDFGIARKTRALVAGATEPAPALAAASATLGPESKLVGTPHYMAPEQMRGEPLDGRVDQFAWGVLAYELLSGGRLPWPGAADLVALVADVLSKDPVPLPISSVGARPAVADVVMRTIRRSREARYPSMDDVLEALGERTGPQSLGARIEAAASSAGAEVAETVLAVKPALPAKAERRPRRVAIAIAGIAALIAAGAFVASRPRSAAPPSSSSEPTASAAPMRRAVAVVGFKNLSGRDDVKWIGTALAETMTTDLGMGEQIRTVALQDVARMKRDIVLEEVDSFSPETLARIGKRLGVDLVVSGTYLAVGAKVRLDVKLQRAANGEVLIAVSESGNEADFIDIVARAGASLRRRLEVSALSTAQATGVRASQPARPEAARAYAEGLAKLRSYDAIGAREALERAVTLDPAFAPGHAALAEALALLGLTEPASEAAKKAIGLSEGLRREERMTIEARYRESIAEWPKAIEIYQALRDSFPDNLDYGVHLASAQVQGDKAAEALATLGALRRLPAPLGDDPRIDLAEAEAHEAIGDYRAAGRAAERARAKGEALGASSLVARTGLLIGWGHVSMGEHARGTEVLEAAKKRAAATGDRLILLDLTQGLAAAHHYQGDSTGAATQFSEAAAGYRELGNHHLAASALSNRAIAEIDLGRFDDADRDAAVAEETQNPSLIATGRILRGRVAALRGDLGKARAGYSFAIRTLRDTQDHRSLAWVQTLLGELAVEELQLGEAEGLLQESLATRERLGLKLFTGESRLATARLAFARGALDDAEAAARAAAEILAGERAKCQEAEARSMLVRILVAKARAADARAPLARARELSAGCQNPAARIAVSVAAAEAAAAGGDVEPAKRDLEAALAEAVKVGYLGLGLEARIGLAGLEIAAKRLPDGARALAQVARDAEARGLARLARDAKARAAAKGAPGKR